MDVWAVVAVVELALARRKFDTGVWSPACERLEVAPSAGSSSNLAIICILRCLARRRPLTSRCLAAIHRMWSSKMHRAASNGLGGGRVDAAGPPVIEVGRKTVTCRQRLSSLSPLTSTSLNSHNHK